jgi:hypothetical protein
LELLLRFGKGDLLLFGERDLLLYVFLAAPCGELNNGLIRFGKGEGGCLLLDEELLDELFLARGE